MSDSEALRVETKLLAEDYVWFYRSKIEEWDVGFMRSLSEYFSMELAYGIMSLTRAFRREVSKIMPSSFLHPFSSGAYRKFVMDLMRSLIAVEPRKQLCLCHLFAFTAQVVVVVSENEFVDTADTEAVVSVLCECVEEMFAKFLIESGGYSSFTSFVLREEHRLFLALNDTVAVRFAKEAERRKPCCSMDEELAQAASEAMQLEEVKSRYAFELNWRRLQKRKLEDEEQLDKDLETLGDILEKYLEEEEVPEERVVRKTSQKRQLEASGGIPAKTKRPQD